MPPSRPLAASEWPPVDRIQTPIPSLSPAAPPRSPAANTADLAPVKAFLLDHTDRLVAETKAAAGERRGLLRARRGGGLRLREAAQRATAPRCRSSSRRRRRASPRANPAYEEMEGVVAGVPSLADYDVIIDAGGDASDPENAVPFSLKTPDGQDLQAARQLQLPDRDGRLRHRAEVRGQGRQARPRRRRQGRVRRGDARRRLLRHRRARLREDRRRARRRRAAVEADAARTPSPRSS